ncbi:DUF2273 domain-containing protein [Tractidigestivibacter scatoligenes]|uniref:DUF2273 domain-containing protein n=1 Tax=Tractidigestivibacter scatoligenes TaxID=1299998 RepID=UPI0009E92587|nr:DUF2273 domain-containing protein [Tractidigestivibacter scatoligenes]
MSDEFTKAPRAKVEAEEPQVHQVEKDEESTPRSAEQSPSPTGAPHGDAAGDGVADSQNGVGKASAWVSRTFPGHENAFLGGVCGFLVAIVMAAIGFWRTLLLVILVLIGVAIGQQADGDPKILRTLGKLFRDRDGR